MRKIKKIGGAIITFILGIYNVCFADVVFSEEQARGHGRRIIDPKPETNNVMIYILIGIFVIAVIVCAVLIIRKIIKAKKEKENNNGNNQ